MTATEAEIAEASVALARGGVYVEPTCAQAAAAFAKLRAAGEPLSERARRARLV